MGEWREEMGEEGDWGYGERGSEVEGKGALRRGMWVVRVVVEVWWRGRSELVMAMVILKGSGSH
jgi:hypothetical protein